MNPCTLGWYLPLLVQDKDDGALLQPSEPPTGKHPSPFASTFPAPAKIPAEFAGGANEACKPETDGTLPPSGAKPGCRLKSEVQVGNSNPSKGSRKLDQRSSSNWEALDAQFRRGLPDKPYKERLGYRGLIMRACPRIEVLDGVRTSEKERRKAEALLKHVLKEVDAARTGTHAGSQR